MHCKETEKIGPYLNSRLTDTEKEAFEKHLQTCQSCSAELKIFQSLKETVKEKETQVFLPDVTKGIMNKIETTSGIRIGNMTRRKTEWKVAAKVYPKKRKQ